MMKKGKQGGMAEDGMMQHHAMMEKRMDMMQHDQAMVPMPAKKLLQTSVAVDTFITGSTS
ncbi:MAG: hypothetical protein Q7T25_16095 [Sideroxyarcus sp.]|nr:hypothetical protein [Sideroxyarcus sp.]